ncbi:hypothetical protein [Bacillus mesophilum]|uniref:Uncharacterized protein n=1 Tax=Bacillus mesophilum TaxID=1071718 RepID=A0A7V7RPA5_9BACI|nr:hypothetical protein [Bacillus mesophilum]KAB2335082.1 hypothetical protein F7732_00465 [Bacillus mesophilum]
MPTVESVDAWIRFNVLDSQAWTSSERKYVAFVQANRTLSRSYSEAALTDELIAYQAIWELQGLDPALKYQKQGVKSVSDGSDRIDYNPRDVIAPDVRMILGTPLYEIEEEEESSPPLFGGTLL